MIAKSITIHTVCILATAITSVRCLIPANEGLEILIPMPISQQPARCERTNLRRGILWHKPSNTTSTCPIRFDGILGGCSDCKVFATDDYVFKRIFGNKEQVKDFVQQILVGENKIFPHGSKIKTIHFGPTEHIQNHETTDAMRMIVDVELETSTEIYMIEIQGNMLPGKAKHFFKRVQFYATLAYSHQIVEGSFKPDGKSSMRDYSTAKKVISISILGRNSQQFPQDSGCVQIHRILNVDTGQCIMQSVAFVIIELCKFNWNIDELTADAKDWLHLLSTSDVSYAYTNPHVKSAVKTMIHSDKEYCTYVKDRIEQESMYIKEKACEQQYLAERERRIAEEAKRKAAEAKLKNERKRRIAADKASAAVGGLPPPTEVDSSSEGEHSSVENGDEEVVTEMNTFGADDEMQEEERGLEAQQDSRASTSSGSASTGHASSTRYCFRAVFRRRRSPPDVGGLQLAVSRSAPPPRGDRGLRLGARAHTHTLTMMLWSYGGGRQRCRQGLRRQRRQRHRRRQERRRRRYATSESSSVQAVTVM